jgi:hypothetical protein
LRTAVAALAEQRIAGQALGVHAAKHRRAVSDIAQAEHNVLAPVGFFEKAMHGERGVGSLEAATKTTGTGCS